MIAVHNAKRYAICALPAVALLTIPYGPFVLVVVPLGVPGVLASVAFVSVVPTRAPRAVLRIASIVSCAVLSYGSIAALQSILDRSGTTDFWSPTWAITFLGGLTGLIFGCVAILPASPSAVRQAA